MLDGLLFTKIPSLLKAVYRKCLWKVNTKEKILYLTFDDGPIPEITPFILDELKKYNAKATFFCIGKNVLAYPDIYRRIIEEGHATGLGYRRGVAGRFRRASACVVRVESA